MTFAANIRPVELRKDLSAVADLIELCFAENMDPEGKDYIRHIRQIARGLGNFLLEGTTPENSQLPFHGYVWEENGTIIGNLTLIRVRKKDQGTYFIANVAVHPDYRGRGIAHQLTDRAISHVSEHGGNRIFLQVRDDNPVAIHIYQVDGFEEMTRRTTWFLDEKVKAKDLQPGQVQVTARKKEDWQQQKLWLRDTYPESIAWNLPFHLERLAPGFINWLNMFLNGGNIRNWSARKNGALIGTATWENGFSSSDYLWLASSPVWEEEAIAALLPAACRSFFLTKKFLVNYPAGRGVEAFKGSGMQELHTLIWMSKVISDE